MIIKNADDKAAAIEELNSLQAATHGVTRKRVEEELRQLVAGERAEKNAAYLRKH